MKQRSSFSSFGEIACNPDGELFCQIPTRLIGDLSKALQFAYLGILRAWNGWTKTDASRREILEFINEERAKKGRGPITDRRTVTWYFSVLKELKVLTREHDPEEDVWVTESTMPIRARLQDKPAAGTTTIASEAGASPTNDEFDFGGAPPPAEKVVRGLLAEKVVRGLLVELRNAGWDAVLNDDGDPCPKRLRPDAEPPDQRLRNLLRHYRDDLRAFLEANRPARE